MDSSLFHEAQITGQGTCLSEIRRLKRDDFPNYMKNWFLATSKLAELSEKEIRIITVIVSAFSNVLSHYNNPRTAFEKKQTQWCEIPIGWRIIYGFISIAFVFLFSLIGALINPALAGLLSIVGLVVGLVITRLWANVKFGLGKEKALEVSPNYLPIDAEESYNQMMILSDTLDRVLEINRYEQEIRENSGLNLTTDILISIQKLIGSSKRGDSLQVIRDYIENLEDILPHSGIRVLHYPEGGVDAFEIVSGKLHGVEVLPALSDNNGIIIPGKYMQ